MRFYWIDSLKGIGIISVVLAHWSLHGVYLVYLTSFIMPLFFFISGFLFDFDKYSKSTTSFLKGRFKSLMVPYFSFAIITTIFFFFVDAVYQPGVTNVSFFKSGTLYAIYSILYGNGTLISFNEALWFIPCLFVTELLFYACAKKYYSEPMKLIICLTVAGVFGYLYPSYLPFRLPFGADIALTGVVFYGAGNMFRKITEPIEKSKAERGTGSSFEQHSKFMTMFSKAEKSFPIVFIPLNLLFLGYLLTFSTKYQYTSNLITTYQYVDMNYLRYGGFFSFYLLAFSGTFTFVYIFKKMRSFKVLEYYGKNTLIVLSLHIPIREFLRNLATMIFGVQSDYFFQNKTLALSLTVLNLLCLIPLIFLFNNYLPFLIGKKGFSILLTKRKSSYKESYK